MPSTTFATSGRDLIGHRIDNGRLEFLSVLGVGAYGVVYLSVDLHSPQPVYLAVKCLLRAKLDSRQRHFQDREIALHQLVSDHPNIVNVHNVIEEDEYIYVVMDYCEEGDLFGLIVDQQRYIGNDDLIKKVFIQICDAVEFCHSMGIFHRDLKPENILCTKGGERIYIADFGLATADRDSAEFGCGSTFYLSPECQGGLFDRLTKYNTKQNDIWSLGVILVNLTCGRNPWKQACPTDETFRAYVHDTDFLRTILPISKSTNTILKSLFHLDPLKRPSLRVVKEAIMAIDTFTMSEEELSNAHSAAKAAAASVRHSLPSHGVHTCIRKQKKSYQDKWSRILLESSPYYQAKLHQRQYSHGDIYEEIESDLGMGMEIEIESDLDVQMEMEMEDSYSTYSLSQYDLDPSFIQVIDFSTNRNQNVTAQKRQRQQLGMTQLEEGLEEFQGSEEMEERSYLENLRLREQQSTPSLLHPRTRRYSNSNSSSSSEETNIPPTPEFIPVNKGHLADVPKWELGKQVITHDMDSQSHSPTKGRFIV